MGFTCAMRTLLSRATQADPSFNVGLGLIVILAVAEIFAATFYYIGRARAARVSAQAIAATIAAHDSASSTSRYRLRRRSRGPPAAAVTPPRSLHSLISCCGKAMSCVNAATRQTRSPVFRKRWIANRTIRRARGIAKTYESMQLFDRANEVWRKSRNGSVRQRGICISRPSLEAGSAGSADRRARRRSEAAVPAQRCWRQCGGSIRDYRSQNNGDSDPEAETNLALEIGIKKQPGAAIDHTKVKILVFLYDTVDDRDIKLTDADVNYEWLTPKHDWTDTNPEVLS